MHNPRFEIQSAAIASLSLSCSGFARLHLGLHLRLRLRLLECTHRCGLARNLKVQQPRVHRQRKARHCVRKVGCDNRRGREGDCRSGSGRYHCKSTQWCALHLALMRGLISAPQLKEKGRSSARLSRAPPRSLLTHSSLSSLTFTLPLQFTSKMRSSSLLVLAAVAGSASATGLTPFGTPPFAAIHYYADPGCDSTRGAESIVTVPQDYCHLVPGDVPANNRGYRVSCDPFTGTGVMQFCSASDCSVCEAGTSFASNQCLPNDVAAYGSAALRVDCNPTFESLDVCPPRAGHAQISFFADPGCSTSFGSRSLVEVPQGLCHRVPSSSIPTGYLVSCDASGTFGTLAFCNSDCSICASAASLGHGVCAPNNPIFGSASVQLQCPFPVSGFAQSRNLRTD
jgi:hypothetical protein